MKVSAIQCGASEGDAPGNVKRVCDWIEQAAQQGCALVVLPECVLTGYGYSDRESLERNALPMDGPEVASVVATCRQLRIWAVVGLFELNGERVHNTAFLAGPDGLVGLHRKNHLPYLGGDRFADLPASATHSVFETAIGIVGIAICYEIRFPEVARTLMLAGADIIALPTNWPLASRILAEHFAPVRAAENMVYFIAANRNDSDGDIQYLGRSLIIDPFGKVLADAAGETGVISAEIDIALSRNKKIVFEAGKFELSPISDRRPETYRI
jgi:predicted amidohydrolase